MAKDADKSEAEKPKGGALKIALGAVLLLVIGAGGAYGAFAAGVFGDASESGPDLPKLVKKGASDPYASPDSGKGKEEIIEVYGDGGSEYRTAYYSFADDFTSNLADSPALIQVELAVSTQHDGRVLSWVRNHELAIRSAILVQLAATPEADVFEVAGREKLNERLTQSINDVLEEKEGFGGIASVHFKGFLVQ